MKYSITGRVRAVPRSVEITSEQFKAVKDAKTSLMNALFMEEKLNYVVENYCEMERELFTVGLNDILFSDQDWSRLMSELHAISRRIVNLLSSCRLYLDQIVRNVHTIYGRGSAQAEALVRKKSEERDSVFGYRVMGALRNHVQHCGLPLHCLGVGGTLVDGEPGSAVRHTVTAWLRVAALEGNTGFDKAVLSELRDKGEDIDLKPLIREYVASIGRVHLTIRGFLEDGIARWEATLTGAMAKLGEGVGGEVAYCSGEARDECGKLVERVGVFDDFMRRRRELVRKNQHLAHCARHFVTGEVDDA